MADPSDDTPPTEAPGAVTLATSIDATAAEQTSAGHVDVVSDGDRDEAATDLFARAACLGVVSP